MTELIPAVLAHNEAEFRAKVERVRGLGLAVHIDVMDGRFTPSAAWAQLSKMRDILGKLVFDAHLMVADPEMQVPMWLAAGARHVIFHTEATLNEGHICRAAGERCADLAVAFNPTTPMDHVTTDVGEVPQVMVMGVTPGKTGQPFQMNAIERVAILRKLYPHMRITVDGGVKPGNARALRDAGADALVVGSALTEAADPHEALKAFKKALGIV